MSLKPKVALKISSLILSKYPFLERLTKDLKILSATMGLVNNGLMNDFPTTKKRIFFIGGSGQIIRELSPAVSLFTWRKPWLAFRKLPAETVIEGIRSHAKNSERQDSIFHIVALKNISSSDYWRVVLFNVPPTCPDFERWVDRKCGL